MLLQKHMRQCFRRVYLRALVIGLALCGGVLSHSLAAAQIANPEAYFHAPIGSVWHYQGILLEKEIQLTSTDAFTNSATAVKTMEKNGQDVIVFMETNPGNMGEAESYYHIGHKGVVYHGGLPQQLFEQQLIPYPVIKFPLVEHQTFRQFHAKDRDFFQDLDGDGLNERVDALAQVTVGDLETLTVPAGMFQNVLRLNGKMELSVTMSSNGDVIVTRDRLSSWFAPGVGLIKYTETISVPVIGDDMMRTTVITEELEEYRITERSLGSDLASPRLFYPVSNLPVTK